MKNQELSHSVLAGLLMTFTACQEDSDDIGTDLDVLELESEVAMETT